jgi:tRNA U34 5-carboxymethylaminomethyl modifying enzyme MnmG/GidA
MTETDWNELIKHNNLMLENYSEACSMNDSERIKTYKKKYTEADITLRTAINELVQQRDERNETVEKLSKEKHDVTIRCNELWSQLEHTLDNVQSIVNKEFNRWLDDKDEEYPDFGNIKKEIDKLREANK